MLSQRQLFVMINDGRRERMSIRMVKLVERERGKEQEYCLSKGIGKAWPRNDHEIH